MKDYGDKCLHLTTAQRGLWFSQKMNQGAIMSIAEATEICGPVQPDARRGSSFIADRRRDGARRVIPDVGRDDDRPVAREQAANCLPQASACAGDEANLAVQPGPVGCLRHDTRGHLIACLLTLAGSKYEIGKILSTASGSSLFICIAR